MRAGNSEKFTPGNSNLFSSILDRSSKLTCRFKRNGLNLENLFFIDSILDLISQVTLLGLFSFIKSLSAYLIGSINLHESVWDRKVKYIVLIATYFTHFFLYFYVVINDNASWYVILQYSTLQSIFTFGIFWILNSFIFHRKLI